jgi:uncharacterized protein YhfF
MLVMVVPMPTSHAFDHKSSGGPAGAAATVSPCPKNPSCPSRSSPSPGELRDQLVAAILAGAKTTTSCLELEYELDGAPLPDVGRRSLVIDSNAHPVAVIELTALRVLPLGQVDERHARDEGEGFTTVDAWRRAHEDFWHSPEYRDAIRQPEFTVDDATRVVALRFRLVEDLRADDNR